MPSARNTRSPRHSDGPSAEGDEGSGAAHTRRASSIHTPSGSRIFAAHSDWALTRTLDTCRSVSSATCASSCSRVRYTVVAGSSTRRRHTCPDSRHTPSISSPVTNSSSRLLTFFSAQPTLTALTAIRGLLFEQGVFDQHHFDRRPLLAQAP